MRLVNVTYKIYEFSELSEDVKTKVKEWYLNNFYQNEEFSDMCKEELSHRFPNEPIKENKEDADDDVRDQLYFGVQCGHPYGSDYMYEIFTGRNGYDIEFKCKNKKEVLQVIDQLAKDFEKEKHQ